MTNRNRFHITDTETYNNTGEVLIDHPAMIASMARTHIIDIKLTNIPEYRGDLYENRIASRIRNAAKRMGVDVTVDIHRNSSVVVRPLTEAQARAKAGSARQAAKTRAMTKRLRGC